MKIISVTPEVSNIDIDITGLKYKNEPCDTVIIRYSLTDKCVLQAICDEPYFIMGGGFWNEAFGKRQANFIRKKCHIAALEYIKNNSGD